jgi:hypothetical protein
VSSNFGRLVAREVRNGEERVFSSGQHTVAGLVVPHDAIALLGAASRKSHGVGALDVPMPLTGPFGVESRSGGANGNHTLVFTFSNDVIDGSAAVTAGPGSISGNPVLAGNTFTVNLTGIPDGRTVTVTLSNVTDSFSQVLPDIAVTAGFLFADANGDRRVNVGDTVVIKAHSGENVMFANAALDLNGDGRINVGDTNVAKSQAGNSLSISGRAAREIAASR